MSNSALYGESSIGQLQGADRVRKRPAAVLGSDGLQGAQHGFWEIFGNATDEHSAGFGDQFDIKRYSDGSISFRDYGRGVPMGWNEKLHTYNWHLIYNEMYGGGKYDDNQEKLSQVKDWSTFDKSQYNYLYSIGLNGLGASATQYCSSFFHVESVRIDEVDGKKYKYVMDFEHGLPIIDGRPVDVFKEKYDMAQYHQERTETDEPTGTFIHWKPDSKVFTDTNITAEWLLKTCRSIAYTSGVKVIFEDEDSNQNIVIEPDTLGNFIPSMYPSDILTEESGAPFCIEWHKMDHGVITINPDEPTESPIKKIWVAEADFALHIAKSSKAVDSICYHNLIEMRSRDGVHYGAILDAVAQFLNARAKQRGLSLVNSDFEGVFAFAISSFSNIASFRNQTKDGVDDLFIYKFLFDSIKSRLELEYSKGNPHIMDAVERVMRKADMRIQLKEAEKQIRKVNRTKRMKDPQKFKTCREYMDKNYARTELWIAEGDSAASAIESARDGDFQAVFCIRGKGLNLLKASISKLLDNKEVMDIISLLGTGVDLNIKGLELFNMDNLRFQKIVFATDADVDGFQIRVLLFLIFYRLCPRLITEGHVFIAETPRYALSLTNGEKVYARDEEERDELMKQYVGRVKNIFRYKGLGETGADVLRETTVGVEHRKLVPVTCDFDNELEVDLIDALFGQDKRKQRKEILSMVLGGSVTDDFAETLSLLGDIEEEDMDEDTEVRVWE